MEKVELTKDLSQADDGLDRFLPLEDGASGYGAAVYIGNKNFICRLYELSEGELVATIDVESDYVAKTGHELKESLSDIVDQLAAKADIPLSKVNVAVVSGTTSIEEKTAGCEIDELVYDVDAGCDSFGHETEYILAGSTSITVGKAFFVPCLDSEVGGDFLCSLLAIDILGSKEPVLFISGGSSPDNSVLIAYGNQEAISVCVLPAGSDVNQGLSRLLELLDAEYDHVSRAVIAGESDLVVPQELMNHIRHIEYPAIVGTSAVLLSEAAEDELCRLASECRLVNL